jgi:hypothetical protein
VPIFWRSSWCTEAYERLSEASEPKGTVGGSPGSLDNGTFASRPADCMHYRFVNRSTLQAQTKTNSGTKPRYSM